MAVLPISDAEALLQTLRESPARRAVTYCRDPDWEDDFPAILEYLTHDLHERGRLIAWIGDAGSARQLLDAAYDASLAGDQDAWARLPLRYGPFCSMWVLPEHPAAPQKAGGVA